MSQANQSDPALPVHPGGSGAPPPGGPVTGLTRRRALSLAGSLGVLGLSAAKASAAPSQPGSSQPGSSQPGYGTVPTKPPVARPGRASLMSLDSMFEQAAARYGVPRDLLIAVAWNETRLDDHAGTPSMANGYGLMHLVDNPTNQSLRDASRITGLSPDVLKTNRAANILGGAAVLRATADALALDAGARADLTAWQPVLRSYSGMGDPAVAGLYTQGTYQGLSTGIIGAGVAVTPTAIPSELLASTGRLVGPSISYSSAYSGNYTSANRPYDYPIEYVIVHVVEGTYAGAISWFKSPSARVSAHYVIRSSDGAITQCVPDEDIAWHAGNRSYNQRSIGIEHEGYIYTGNWFTQTMYKSSAALTRSLCDRYGIPKTRSRILGHIEVPGATHTDPGPNWDWSTYMTYVLTPDDPVPSWSVTLDNSSPGFSASGNWLSSDWNPQKLGADYRYTDPLPVTDTAWYATEIPETGQYRVECWYPASTAYNDLVPYVVVTASGNQVVYVNQRHLGGQWRSLGTFSLIAGRSNVVGVSRWARGTGYVIADGIRITRVG